MDQYKKEFKNLAEKKDPNTFEIAQLAANLTLIEHIFLGQTHFRAVKIESNVAVEI
jgi:hypothetical protein